MHRATKATASRPVQPPAGDPGGHADPLLDAAGPLDGVHAIVLGHDTLDTLCRLIARGCGGALEMPIQPHAHPDRTELVLVPHLRDLTQAATAVAMARRCLLPCGRLVLRADDGGLANALLGLLRRAGFSPGRVRRDADAAVVTADWPMFASGPVPHHV